MNKLIILSGMFLCSIFLFFVFIYLNLFTLGYTFLEFVKFSIGSTWFWLLPIGVILIYKGLERNKKNELLLRYKSKFSRHK